MSAFTDFGDPTPSNYVPFSIKSVDDGVVEVRYIRVSHESSPRWTLKVPLEHLLEAVRKAELQHLGKLYAHHSGDLYRVHSIGVSCKTNELEAEYECMGSNPVCLAPSGVRMHRPIADFKGPRFTEVVEDLVFHEPSK